MPRTRQQESVAVLEPPVAPVAPEVAPPAPSSRSTRLSERAEAIVAQRIELMQLADDWAMDVARGGTPSQDQTIVLASLGVDAKEFSRRVAIKKRIVVRQDQAGTSADRLAA